MKESLNWKFGDIRKNGEIKNFKKNEYRDRRNHLSSRKKQINFFE